MQSHIALSPFGTRINSLYMQPRSSVLLFLSMCTTPEFSICWQQWHRGTAYFCWVSVDFFLMLYTFLAVSFDEASPSLLFAWRSAFSLTSTIVFMCLLMSSSSKTWNKKKKEKQLIQKDLWEEKVKLKLDFGTENHAGSMQVLLRPPRTSACGQAFCTYCVVSPHRCSCTAPQKQYTSTIHHCASGKKPSVQTHIYGIAWCESIATWQMLENDTHA